jgi:hypothetical protein
MYMYEIRFPFFVDILMEDFCIIIQISFVVSNLIKRGDTGFFKEK